MSRMVADDLPPKCVGVCDIFLLSCVLNRTLKVHKASLNFDEGGGTVQQVRA